MVLLNNNKSKCFSKIVLTFACFFSSGKFCRRHDTVFTMINKLLRQSTVFKICNLRNPTLISCHQCIPIMVCQTQRFRHLGHNRIRQVEMEKFRPISNGFKNLMSFKIFCTQNVPERKDQTENILTVPNVLTVGRMVMCPFLGFLVIQNDYSTAFNLFVVAGITDLVCNSLIYIFLTF